MKKRVIATALVLALLTPACAALAAPVKSPAEKATENVLARVFSEAEKAIIEEYFGVRVKDTDAKGDKKHKGGKGKGLPPGLAMQVEKNGRLPPGLQKRDLPRDLAKRLPPPRPGTKRIISGADIILVEEATELVIDVIRGAIRS